MIYKKKYNPSTLEIFSLLCSLNLDISSGSLTHKQEIS